MGDCIFCSIASGAIPSEVVLEDGAFVAFRDIHPKAVQHVLIVPRKHITSLNQLEQWKDCEGHALLAFAVRVAESLGIKETGYRLVINIGRDGGQEVQHLHVHVLGGEELGGL